MKKLLYLIVPLALVAAVAFRLQRNKETARSRVYHYDQAQAIPVQADTLRYEQTAAEYAYAGTFEPFKETRLSAETQGKVTAVLAEAGQQVKKGQPLIQLDHSLLQLQLQSVEVQIEGLQADVNRYTALVQADAVQGVQLEKALLGLKSAQVQRNTLLEQIHKSRITAPFSGIVTAKLTEIGAFAAPGVPLLQLTDLARLRFTVHVPEQVLAGFRQGRQYTVSADAYPEMLLAGKAILVGSKANPGNSFPVQLAVANTADQQIKSGMFGKVLLKHAAGQKHLVIPASAIVGSALKPQVYLIKKDKAVLQHITVSGRIQNKALVASGVSAGDVIVTGGAIHLFEGARVKVN